MCERWCRSPGATQITRSGAVTTLAPATQPADHIGGSARTIGGYSGQSIRSARAVDTLWPCVTIALAGLQSGRSTGRSARPPSPGTFSTRFTELAGMSPGAYRRPARRVSAGVPPCIAKQASRPVRNREVPAAPLLLP